MISCIVIDDDLHIVQVFSDILELIGLEVLAQGYDGKDAVELYIEHRPEIIFTDIMMPRYDGFYGIEKIKEFDSDAKIVAVTADISSETEQRLDEFNVTAVIYKPFDIQKIKQVLTQECKIDTA
ncbi:MAG: response regulator [Nitrosarchaeum sp.]